MRRKSRLVTSLLVCSSIVATPAFADKKCRPSPRGTVCLASVPFQRFAQSAYQPQSLPEWCWAACISMVFRFYGHPVAQARIVKEAYGVVANVPAGSGFVIAKQINRRWIDDNGAKFTARLEGAYDFDARVLTVDNAAIAQELEDNHPVIMGNATHALVVTAIEYFDTPEPTISSVGVFDPWPGIGPRSLSPAEMVPMHLRGQLRFLATVEVVDGWD